jgi:phospho-N-acetylmuramoyl-pentapeptide-transferase
MLYYFFDFLEKMDVPGAGLFQYLSFRASVVMIFALLISTIYGIRVIRFLQKKQIGETIRDLGLEGQMQKKGTPTMGGVIIIFSAVIPVLLFAKLDNIYILLLLLTIIWAGTIGFLDDYIKKHKKNKEGLKGKYKILGQVSLGLVVGSTLYFHPGVTIRDYPGTIRSENLKQILEQKQYKDHKSTSTTIPFLKNNEFDYSDLVSWLHPSLTWLVYVLVVTFIITAVSNGANITDGLDGLAAGVSAIILFTLGALAYVSGNLITSNYLQIMYIPESGEVFIFCLAVFGACIGFLWYNAFPAQVFMGDTGSLSLGAVIAVLAVMLRKELMLPLLCGVFLVENLSVIIQVGYFKYTKRKYGEGRRIFLMSPLHHHYQKLNIPEPKIVFRFWVVSIFLAVITLLTLKVR